MPQGIFAWQEKGHREAHPEGERETGRRPRERESTFLGGGVVAIRRGKAG